jgi:hypothetical protein
MILCVQNLMRNYYNEMETTSGSRTNLAFPEGSEEDHDRSQVMRFEQRNSRIWRLLTTTLAFPWQVSVTKEPKGQWKPFRVDSLVFARRTARWTRKKSNSMEQSPWKADSHAADQQILHLLWNLKVHYRVHPSPQLDPVISQLHPVPITRP